MKRISRDRMAIASLILGLISVLACVVPRLGAILCVAGAILGVKGLKSSMRRFAIAGIVICVIALIAANMVAALTGDYGFPTGSS